MYKIAVLVGSLRRDSINRKLAQALSNLSKSKFAFQYLELGDVPMYNEDLWANPPPSVLKLKSDVVAADGVLIVTPEYNRGLPPVVKNAIDWANRPYGQNSWAGKPTALAGASPGAVGTAAAQAQLRSMAAPLGMAVLGQPELYFSFKPGLIDDAGNVTDASTKSFLEKYLASFETWIKAVQQGR